jgi:hypothetical protein
MPVQHRPGRGRDPRAEKRPPVLRLWRLPGHGKVSANLARLIVRLKRESR